MSGIANVGGWASGNVAYGGGATGTAVNATSYTYIPLTRDATNMPESLGLRAQSWLDQLVVELNTEVGNPTKVLVKLCRASNGDRVIWGPQTLDVEPGGTAATGFSQADVDVPFKHRTTNDTRSNDPGDLGVPFGITVWAGVMLGDGTSANARVYLEHRGSTTR